MKYFDLPITPYFAINLRDVILPALLLHTRIKKAFITRNFASKMKFLLNEPTWVAHLYTTNTSSDGFREKITNFVYPKLPLLSHDATSKYHRPFYMHMVFQLVHRLAHFCLRSLINSSSMGPKERAEDENFAW